MTKFAGTMFLLAMIASLTGGMLIQSVLAKPDFINTISNEKGIIVVGVVLELINAFAVLGITAALRIPLKQKTSSMAVGYLGIRIMESISCVAAALIPVLLIMLDTQSILGSMEFSTGLLNTVRDGIIAYGIPLFFGIGGLLLYIMLYRSKLVPKYISVWGLLAAPAVMLNKFVPVTAIKPILALPIIINEIYLGFYLLTKGFLHKD